MRFIYFVINKIIAQAYTTLLSSFFVFYMAFKHTYCDAFLVLNNLMKANYINYFVVFGMFIVLTTVYAKELVQPTSMYYKTLRYEFSRESYLQTLIYVIG